MNDLIYAGYKAEKEIKALFPTAVIEDASDYIHTERFSIALPDSVTDEEYVKAILKSGLEAVSLTVQMMLRGEQDEFDKLKKWLGEIEAKEQK